MKLRTHLIGKAVAQFGEDFAEDDGPNELVVEVCLSLCLASTQVAILYIEEAEVEGEEEAQLTGAVIGFACGSPTLCKGLQLSGAYLELGYNRAPCLIEA